MGNSLCTEENQDIKNEKDTNEIKLTVDDTKNSLSLLNNFVFQPTQYETPEDIEIDHVVEIPSNGYHIPVLYIDGGYDKCVIFSHGNSEDLLTTEEYLRVISSHLGANVCGYDYQGYGIAQKYSRYSNELACHQNIEDVVKFVKDKGFDSEHIILYGRSLGSGISLYYAAHHDFHGKIVLESPYTNIADIIKDKIFLGMFFDMFPSLKYIKSVSNYILFLHGAEDTLIDSSHTDELYKHHSNKMKNIGKKPIKPIIVPKANHNDVVFHLGYDKYVGILKSFIYLDL
jgi:abhydrolase domain-containing protein 17